MRKLKLFIFAIFFSYGLGYSQEISEVYVTSDTLQVYFRQDKILLDSLFRDNGKRLDTFSRLFNRLLNDPQRQVRSILIVSGASPEGPIDRNAYLSNNRAKVVYDYLIGHHLSDASHIEIESRGVDWKGLEARVSASDLPYKDDVLDMLQLPLWIYKNGKIVDGRKKRLMEYQGGKVWRELYDLYFADLRGTRVMIAYNIPKNDTLRPTPSPKTVSVSPQTILPPPIPLYTSAVSSLRKPYIHSTDSHPFYLAIESNLLYDAVVIPNIGMEVGIWKGLTIGGNYQNIWLRNDAWTRWYRFEGFEASINYYINKEKRPFRKHHIGLYGQLVTWDFTIDGRGYLAERWAYGGGFSYGYVLPIGRRFNLDLELGIGYLGGRMHEYIPQDGCRVWQLCEPFHWIGPTKAGVTLQWLIGRGNHNGRKEVRGE